MYSKNCGEEFFGNQPLTEFLKLQTDLLQPAGKKFLITSYSPIVFLTYHDTLTSKVPISVNKLKTTPWYRSDQTTMGPPWISLCLWTHLDHGLPIHCMSQQQHMGRFSGLVLTSDILFPNPMPRWLIYNHPLSPGKQ